MPQPITSRFFTALCILLTTFFAVPAISDAQYCAATATGTCYRYLGQVTFGAINRTTVCADYTSFYKDWTADAASMEQGLSLTLTLRNTSAYTTWFRVWIDWNQDLDFLDAGENVVVSANAGSGGTYVTSITCPLTATLGNTRMRVKADYYNNFGGGPCASSVETETQDYTVTVTAPIPGSLLGVINSYAAVTSICNNEFTVPSSAGFAAGDRVVVIQMRGASMDLTNTATGGVITAIGTAGQYEFLDVLSVTPTTVTTVMAPAFVYDPAAQVQLVRVAYSTLPVSTVAAGGVQCPSWNGTTGGVLVIENPNAVTLNGDINVAGMGFRGGIPTNAAWGCNNAISHEYVYALGSTLSAPRGEGIAGQQISAANTEGRAPAANGGGGGNNVNAGGAGGGNGAAGGAGGAQWLSCADPSPALTQGIPGYDLMAYYTPVQNRLFLGGGGGGGHAGANVAGGGSGGAGGGIVIIRAGSITGTGNILANGSAAAAVSGQWAGGGGGSGGTVLLDYGSFSATITVNTSGGNGGPAYWPNQLGPGGGGGGGVLCVSGGIAPAGLTLVSAGGNFGTWNNDGFTAWGATAGLPGPAARTGYAVPPASTNPASCVLAAHIGLTGVVNGVNKANLSWNGGIAGNDFVLERRGMDGLYHPVYKGRANSFTDQDITPGTQYLYRVRQVDEAGNAILSNVVEIVSGETPNDIQLWPNPATDHFTIRFSHIPANTIHAELMDLSGRRVWDKTLAQGAAHYEFEAPAQAGMYLLRLSGDDNVITRRITVQK